MKLKLLVLISLIFMIKIYTMSSCSWCDKAKEFFKSKNIEFTELNVQDDMEARDEMIKKSRQMKVPVIDINNKIIIGFDENAILKELNN